MTRVPGFGRWGGGGARVGARLPRPARIALQVLVSGAIFGYLLWRIDVRQTLDVIRDANLLYLVAALAIFIATTWGMAWRWQILLASKGIREPLGWLTSLYFVGYAAGQVLPTGIGGDAVRILEHSRRRPDAKGEAAGAVVLERVIGAAGTLVMVAIGLVAAIGRYDDITYLVWIELLFLALVGAGLVLLFSKRAASHLSRLAPLAERVKLERAGRSLYQAMHGYRDRPWVLVGVLALTIVLQFIRVLSIWLCGLAVGVDESPLVYVILGPLLFLVMMVPFTINGLGVREAFFVAFLGRFGVDADAAFATGFLFYVVTIATSLPGGIILLWRSARPAVVRERGV
jgi:uncharacterized protein (TIRG00374 family)